MFLTCLLSVYRHTIELMPVMEVVSFKKFVETPVFLLKQWFIFYLFNSCLFSVWSCPVQSSPSNTQISCPVTQPQTWNRGKSNKSVNITNIQRRQFSHHCIGVMPKESGGKWSKKRNSLWFFLCKWSRIAVRIVNLWMVKKRRKNWNWNRSVNNDLEPDGHKLNRTLVYVWFRWICGLLCRFCGFSLFWWQRSLMTICR